MSRRAGRSVNLWTPGSARDGPTDQPASEAGGHQGTGNAAEPGEEEDLDALLDMYTQQAQAETQQIQQQERRQQRPAGRRGEAQARQEGLETPLGHDNKGFQLLAKMGYRAGSGLGRQEQGSVKPLDVQLRTARAGLGVDEAKRARQQQDAELALQQEAKRARQAELRDQQHRDAQAASFQQRRWWGQLRAAVRAAQQLDEQAGVGSNPLLEEAHQLCFPEEAGKAGEESALDDGQDRGEEEEEKEQPSPKELLDGLLLYLRDTHCYCLFCGCKYDGPDDLQANCPGVEEDQH